jgi:hypothetical protein
MVKKKRHENYRNMLYELENFDNIILKESPSMKFFMSQWSFSTIGQYYKLKKELKKTFRNDPNIYPLVKKLPRNVLFLKKYVFESIFLVLIIALFVFYLIFVPVFKGMISAYVAFAFLVYFFLKTWLEHKSTSLGVIIYELISNLKKYRDNKS